jgi:hypothetical protein
MFAVGILSLQRNCFQEIFSLLLNDSSHLLSLSQSLSHSLSLYIGLYLIQTSYGINTHCSNKGEVYLLNLSCPCNRILTFSYIAVFAQYRIIVIANGYERRDIYTITRQRTLQDEHLNIARAFNSQLVTAIRDAIYRCRKVTNDRYYISQMVLREQDSVVVS